MATATATASPQIPAAKKKRNQPGNPDPEAEVIALSPKTLLATNRFVCEVCGKGFQRDQNLQLHRRGHNLPWKLRQRSGKEPPRKRVYVCPEKSCVHSHPSRALGDLTGIKKHFCRKHGEKKWKCDRCAKWYAVRSDWKAHSKTCGSREYRCGCGTLFSRRDSFITHRAFCDALAEETARISATSNFSDHKSLWMDQSPHSNESNIMTNNNSTLHQLGLANAASMYGNTTFAPSLYSTQHGRQTPSACDMSATALLQKAAQMGVMATSTTSSFLDGLFNQNQHCGAANIRSSLEGNLHGFAAPNCHPYVHCISSKDDLGGETRDFLGVGVQSVCSSSINGWM